MVPYLAPISLETDADTTLTVAAPGLLALLDAENGCTITAVSGGGVDAAQNLADGGALTINADGSYVFDPDSDFDAIPGGRSKATTDVTITVTDGTNTLTTTARVSVTVKGVNDGATAAARTASTPNDRIASGNLLTAAPAIAHPQGFGGVVWSSPLKVVHQLG
ncbi:MAG: VCBS domain-containing protein [Pikeienuella sp.]